MNPWQKASAEWLYRARWGVFATYLADSAGDGRHASLVTPEGWNREVDAFDVEGLTRQLVDVRAPYLILSVGQNSGYYASPNATYDAFTGFPISKCSRRDLIADVAKALSPHGIRLMVYVPPAAPTGDAIAKQRLEAPADARMAAFLTRWEAVLREWAVRWGRDIHGWWVDGPYDHGPYNHAEAPNFRSLAEALKAGNPDALLAFNQGLRTPVYSVTEFDDYTPGEIERDMTVSPGHLPDFSRLARYPRFINGAQFHVLTIMGEWWGKGPVRFPDEMILGYTKTINTQDGTVSWDVPLTRQGLIEPEFMKPLARLGSEIKYEG